VFFDDFNGHNARAGVDGDSLTESIQKRTECNASQQCRSPMGLSRI